MRNNDTFPTLARICGGLSSLDERRINSCLNSSIVPTEHSIKNQLERNLNNLKSCAFILLHQRNIRIMAGYCEGHTWYMEFSDRFCGWLTGVLLTPWSVSVRPCPFGGWALTRRDAMSGMASSD